MLFLKKTINAGGPLVYLQPIFDARNDKVAGYECLMRLQDPENGRIYSIYPFLKTAKRIHLYDTLMRRMVERSLEIFRHVQEHFSINLSYEDIANESFRGFLHKEIAKFPAPGYITFEILETDFIEDFEVVRSFIGEIRNLGCKIAVDDFGSGYSSLENILKLQPDVIKIDGSLIEQVEYSPEARNLVSGIIQMAKSLGSKVVAEFVSSRGIYNMLKETNVDLMQGYYLGKPFAAEMLKEKSAQTGPTGPGKGGNEFIQKEEK